MASGTRTVTETAVAPLTLHLRPRVSLADREKALLQALYASSLFTPEEQDAFANGIDRLHENHARGLTYILVHTVRAAMIRFIRRDFVEPQIFQWQDELFSIIKILEKLPEDTNIEEFVDGFEGIEDCAKRFFRDVEAEHDHIEEEKQALHAKAGTINDGICEKQRAVAIKLHTLEEEHKSRAEKIAAVINSLALEQAEEALQQLALTTEMGQLDLERKADLKCFHEVLARGAGVLLSIKDPVNTRSNT